MYGRDAGNLLKPYLARGQFRCIGATTLAEYREYIEKDGALERRFAVVSSRVLHEAAFSLIITFQVMVNEPTTDEATAMLRGIRPQFERHHKVWIMHQALVTAVTLAQRYMTARRYEPCV